MRFVLNSFPVAAPVKPQVRPKSTDRLILRRLIDIFAPIEHTDIEGDSKIVVRITATRVGNDVARFRSTLRVEIVLFLVSSETTDHFDSDAVGSRLCDKCARVWLHFREQCRNHSFASIIHLISRCLWRRRVWTDPIVNRLPRFGTWLAIGIDTECFLNCADNLVKIHIDRLYPFMKRIQTKQQTVLNRKILFWRQRLSLQRLSAMISQNFTDAADCSGPPLSVTFARVRRRPSQLDHDKNF